jgi:histidinol-phosphate aminotransferase
MLKAQGILVRYFDEHRLADKLRITIGKPDENQRLLAELAAFLNQ